MASRVPVLAENNSTNNYKAAAFEQSPKAGQMVDRMMRFSGSLLDDSG